VSDKRTRGNGSVAGDPWQAALDTALAEVLAELVDERGWTIARLSAQTGVSRQTLRSWKEGAVDDPRILGVAKLFALAGRSLDLLDGAPAAGRESLGREEIRQIVDEQLAATLSRGLTLELKEERAGLSLQDDPERLRESVAAVKAQLALHRQPAVASRKRTG
jgi:transcriptional regulator with XRE-family HTH domain